MQNQNNTRSAILWILNFQRKIWEIVWAIWTDRNDYMHQDGKTIHSTELEAINHEIQREWETGRLYLDLGKHSNLFRGDIQQQL